MVSELPLFGHVSQVIRHINNLLLLPHD